MKITGITAAYPRYQHLAHSWRTHFWQIVVRVETDTGITGHGYGGGGVASVEVVNRHFRELLDGRAVDSAEDIAAVWDELYEASLPYGRRGIAVMALSGVDLALWDALGKAEGKPVYELLGGARKQRVRAYATGTDQAWFGELGFTATKFPHRWTGLEREYDTAVAFAERVVREMGPEAQIMIDTYMTWTPDVTRNMASNLRDYNPYWFEDVCTPDHLDEQAALRPEVKPTLIAGGEHEFTHHGFREVARAGALDLWQPDITWCGGITAGLRILDVAREHGIPVVPHRGGEPWGLHFIVATECDDLAEVVLGTRDAERDALWLDEPAARDGYIAPTDAPGFGVRLNEEMM